MRWQCLTHRLDVPGREEEPHPGREPGNDPPERLGDRVFAPLALRLVEPVDDDEDRFVPAVDRVREGLAEEEVEELPPAPLTDEVADLAPALREDAREDPPVLRELEREEGGERLDERAGVVVRVEVPLEEDRGRDPPPRPEAVVREVRRPG